jgi:type IV secretion system protein TrbF
MSLFKRSRSAEGNGPLIPAEETHGKKAKRVDAIAAMATQPNTPAVVFGKGMAAFAEIYGSSKVDAARWFVVAMLSILLAITAMAAVSVLMPLKEVRPWVVEINPETGIVNRPVQVERIDPNLAVVKAELARWVEAVYTLDPLRTSELMRWANSRAADKAVAQFTEFRARERVFERIRNEKDLAREVKVTAVDASARGTAFIFITTTERVGSSAPSADRIKRFRVTLNYRLTPATQEAELLANPLGILVTYFSDAEERAQ